MSSRTKHIIQAQLLAWIVLATWHAECSDLPATRENVDLPVDAEDPAELQRDVRYSPEYEYGTLDSYYPHYSHKIIHHEGDIYPNDIDRPYGAGLYHHALPYHGIGHHHMHHHGFHHPHLAYRQAEAGNGFNSPSNTPAMYYSQLSGYPVQANQAPISNIGIPSRGISLYGNPAGATGMQTASGVPVILYNDGYMGTRTDWPPMNSFPPQGMNYPNGNGMPLYGAMVNKGINPVDVLHPGGVSFNGGNGGAATQVTGLHKDVSIVHQLSPGQFLSPIGFPYNGVHREGMASDVFGQHASTFQLGGNLQGTISHGRVTNSNESNSSQSDLNKDEKVQLASKSSSNNIQEAQSNYQNLNNSSSQSNSTYVEKQSINNTGKASGNGSRSSSPNSSPTPVGNNKLSSDALKMPTDQRSDVNSQNKSQINTSESKSSKISPEDDSSKNNLPNNNLGSSNMKETENYLYRTVTPSMSSWFAYPSSFSNIPYSQERQAGIRYPYDIRYPYEGVDGSLHIDLLRGGKALSNYGNSYPLQYYVDHNQVIRGIGLMGPSIPVPERQELYNPTFLSIPQTDNGMKGTGVGAVPLSNSVDDPYRYEVLKSDSPAKVPLQPCYQSYSRYYYS